MAYTAANTTGLYPPPTQLSWAYNYYSLPNASNNVGAYPYTSGYPLRFIPLLFNDQSSLTSVWSANVNYSIANYGTDAVFSFNEPDACFGGLSSCMSVAQAITVYTTYIQPFAGRVQLGAPAVTNAGGGLTWLQQFLGNATQNCLTVDFVNIHWYASPYNMQYFIDYMNNASIIAQGRPIWITEYGMDYNGGNSYAETAVQAFVKNTTYYCDQQPSTFIYRYAWFGNYQNNLLNSAATALSPRGLLWDNYTGGYVYSFNKRGESTGLWSREEEEEASSWLDASPEEIDDPVRGKWNWKDAGGHIDPDWISFVRGEMGS